MDDSTPGVAPVHVHHHAVQFYGTEDSLFATVAGFLSEGLIAGQPAIVIATEGHRKAIVERLAARLIDVETAKRLGDLVLLDAQDMLDMFMADDVPDPAAFETSVGVTIEQIVRDRSDRTIVRAYGEMVDVLWKAGLTGGAIRLEILWNQLATKYGFALLCGYSMGNFYKQAEKFQEVCRQHTHVLDAGPNVVMLESKRSKS